MPNYLNKPIASDIQNNYVSQFVPLPLEIFARANQKNQSIQDDQVAQENQTSDALWKIQPIANEDKEYTNSLRTGFDDAAKLLSGTDLTQKENQDKVRDLIKNTSRDPTLGGIVARSSEYAEWQKNKSDMQKAGTYTPENDMGAASFRNYAANGGYKSGLTIDSTVIKYTEERPVMEKFFDNVGDDGGDIMRQVGQTYYNDGFKGITAGKINSRALAAYQGYASTPEAQQGKRRFALLSPKAQASFKGGADEYVFKQFLDAGLERVHQTTSSGRASALNDDRKEKKADAKEKEEKTNLFNGMASNEIPSTLFDGMEVEYDSKGKLVGDGRGVFANIKEAVSSGNYNPIDMYTNWKNDTRYSDDQNTRLKSVMVGAALSGVSDKKYAAHFDKTWTPVLDKVLVGTAIKANNDAFMNGGAGVWSHMVVSKDGKGSMGLIEALQQSFDNVPDPRKDAAGFKEFLKTNDVQVTGSYRPNLLSAKPIEITINRTTFAADLTGGGRNMEVFKDVAERKAAMLAHNQAKLNAGQQIEEIDSKGNTVIYFKNLSKFDKETGDYTIDHKIIPKK